MLGLCCAWKPTPEPALWAMRRTCFAYLLVKRTGFVCRPLLSILLDRSVHTPHLLVQEIAEGRDQKRRGVEPQP